MPLPEILRHLTRPQPESFIAYPLATQTTWAYRYQLYSVKPDTPLPHTVYLGLQCDPLVQPLFYHPQIFVFSLVPTDQGIWYGESPQSLKSGHHLSLYFPLVPHDNSPLTVIHRPYRGIIQDPATIQFTNSQIFQVFSQLTPRL
jgi:hypothetical protein